MTPNLEVESFDPLIRNLESRTSSKSLTKMDSEKTKHGIVRSSNQPSLVTFVSAVVAFSLALVALLSGAGDGKLQNYQVVMVSHRQNPGEPLF
jgi:hypothetical protein